MAEFDLQQKTLEEQQQEYARQAAAMLHAVKHQKNKLNKKHGILFNVFVAFMWIWAISLFAVIIWGFLISLRDGYDYALDPLRVIPENFDFKWENYWTAIQTMEYNDTNYVMMIFNSLWFSFGATFMKLWATTMLAYVMAQYEFRGKKALYAFLIIQIMLPVYGQTTANFIFLNNLGLVNTPLFLLALGAGHGMHFLIMHSYFSNLSKTYREAAEIDGANDFTTCFRIMLPLGMSSILAIGLLSFIGTWNDYSTVILYLENFPTLAAGLYKYQVEAIYSLDPTIYFAGIFMAALPTAILFIVFNKTLMENITIGGIKG
ncbi:MAG: carbohydrate ABC transporter permease [Clostridia bacterium]|nr:carbohydrate ABC transporter permease [Clostridia bacterium]MBQ8405297.1 carbohydrate ABC transporter permease [Clostridia bacterium]